jgi:alkylation response protein AidB-like acyl-CoA dehydrogenase
MYALERFGSEGQRRRWLPALAAGERLATIAFTEPEAGSDAGAIRTRAARAECGDGWVLEGTKCWITHGGDADLMIVSARTGELALGLRGVSAFLVEREADGVELVGLEEKTGLGGSPTAALALPAIALPGDRLLGALGQGGAVMLSGVGMTRVAIAAQALGIGKRAFEAAARFALERVQGGCRIVEHDAVRARLAEMALALFAIENLVCWDARLEARGDWHVREMSIAKYYASEALQELTQRAIGVHGGCGCARCCEVERCRREAVALPLFGGTSEIQWFIIARELADDERAGTGYRRRDGALCAELAARAAGSPRLAALAARLADAVETLWRCAERVAALEPELRAPCERELAELATASAVAQALLWQATAAGAGALEHELAAAALDRLGERAATTVAAIASGDPRRELKRLVREQLE